MKTANNPTIWINGRFLTRKITGVERVAIELLSALVRQFADHRGQIKLQGIEWQLALALPPTPLHQPIPEALAVIPTHIIGKLQGHAWEQWCLPKATKGQWLINLCNTAPLFKTQQLVFIHDAQVYAIPDNFSRSFRLWYKCMANMHVRYSAILCTNSYFSKHQLMHYVSPRFSRASVMHLGVDHVDTWQQQPAETTIIDALPKSPFLLAVASINPNKNLNLLVDAIKQLDDKAPPTVLVGGMAQKVFAASQLDTSRVTTLGYVDDATLYELYQKAFALVFPSQYEGFGLPPLEAMRLNCPVIASDIGAVREVCGDAVIYCNPNDVNTLVSAIRQLQSHPEQRDQLKQRGKAHAAPFSWQNMAISLHHLLNTHLAPTTQEPSS